MEKKGGKKKSTTSNYDCYEIIPIDHNSRCKGNQFVSEDIAITAEKGKVALRDFPHPRHLCGNRPFATTSHEIYCAKCYCLVCEKPAPQCQEWKGSDGHCHITERVDKVNINVIRVEESDVNRSNFLKRCFCFS
ncbi:uncharacterized protein [Typha angustifolia]|uniref:uncharacterized protein isoform X1 n=1 Tax=Typha angustifolia TaxID=59011 RepID=UPI003C2FE70E